MRWAHVGGPPHGLWLAGDPGGTVCHQLEFVLRNDAEGRVHERCKFRNHINRSIWSNYSDLTRPHPKGVAKKGRSPLFQ